MKQKQNRGFTLIELLVVIAIIGILASVVLASLNTARKKGTVAAYKSEVSSLVTDILLACDGSTGTHNTTAGSQTNAVTGISCPSFNDASVSTTIPASGTHNCVGTVNINGAVFTGTDC